MPQQGADLSTRLITTFQQCFAAGYLGVLATDSDSPTLPTGFLQQAVDVIATSQTDVVLGPSDDGGYYLIGLRQVHHELFASMPWSTPQVLTETLRRAEVKGLKVTCLPPWFDIDTPADLARLRDAVTQMQATAPQHTRRFFLERA
jgi:glycosyltransferase A (GT-A) superfamily protein (DUF2064 family)